jgi:AcrR family transcriptional regulator
VCNNIVVGRKYELKRRAERQEETRRRIVDAAIDLHRTKGPGRTTISDIARRAGVQRHTFYRHFPDERSLGLACSGLHMERNPPPDADTWLTIPDPCERRRHGLDELYAWYAENEEMFASVLRDAELYPLVGELFVLRAGEAMARVRAVIAEGLSDDRRVQAAVDLALDFHAWRRLARSGLSPGEAAETMAEALRCL